MGVISSALRSNHEIYFLVEINLEGRKLRYSTVNLDISYSGGSDLLFKGKLKSEPTVSKSFDFRSFRYSASSVSITIINDDRLQDLETKVTMDYATGKIWIWNKELDWSEIKDSPIFSGVVRRGNYNRNWYNLEIIDFSSINNNSVPSTTITGTPSEIINSIVNSYSGLKPNQVDYGSIWDLNLLLGSLSLSVLVDKWVTVFDLIDRILGQCKCARTQRNGKLAMVTFDLDGPTSHYIGQNDLESEIESISSTPYELLCNNLSVSYGPAAGAWGTTVEKNRLNNLKCKESYAAYGEQLQAQLLLADCDESFDAEFCINRHLSFFAFRHDILPLDLQFYKAWDMKEGDIAKITFEEGSSSDGNGWVDERFILVEKSFYPNFIKTKWWKIEI